MSSSDPHCSDCVHAALDSSGVYCKLFHEQIFDEKVAAECGEYEPEVWPEPAAAEIIPVIFRPHLVVEADEDRVLACHIEVEYFGKSDHGAKILKNLEREMACLYGERARVKQV